MSAMEELQIGLSYLRGLRRIKGKNKYTHSNLKLTRQPSLSFANTHLTSGLPNAPHYRQKEICQKEDTSHVMTFRLVEIKPQVSR